MSRTNRYEQNAAGPSQPQIPPLGALGNGYGLPQTTSPRSELLSSSSTERRRAQGGHDHSGSRRKHRRSSDKHNRTKDAPSDTSQRELLRIVLEQEAEADNLKKALRTTLQQLDEEAQKVVEYEKGTKEVAERFKQINESRLAAEQQALQANQQLHVYEFQLQNAEREIQTTQETLRVIEKQKEDAEELAARARARARKLHQRQILLQAKEEGRRLGFEAGIKQAQEELVITATARKAVAQGRLGHSSRRKEQPRRSSRSATPPLQSPEGEGNQDDYQDENRDDNQDQEDETLGDSAFGDDNRNISGDGDSDILRSPIIPRTHTYPLHPESNVGPLAYDSTMRASTSLPQPSTSNPPDVLATPDVQIYSLPIPPPDQISSHPSHRPPGWVTAQEHRDINGSQTSHNTSRRTMSEPAPPAHIPPGARFPPKNSVNQVPAQRPPSRLVPPPAPILAVPYGDRPHGPSPLKSSGSARKILRFPSLAKSKAQSWYRSLSLRKKSKPVIDPIEEEEPPTPQGNGHPDSERGSQELYKFQPEAPKSWYQQDRRSTADVKSQKSQNNLLNPHGYTAPMDDRGNDRVSRASTRFSQLDMISSAPNRYQNDGNSISGLSTIGKGLAQKLSTIKEDSQRYSHGESIPFMLPPRLDNHSQTQHRKRPSDILVPVPPGFDPNDPFVQGNYHLFPNGNPTVLPPPMMNGTQSTGSSGDIGINVQPATAALHPPSAAIPVTGNHLTPTYVYQPPAPLRAPHRDPVMVNWDPTSPSNASFKSRQSNIPHTHRPTQSYDDRPSGYSKPPSVRSKHSRATSAMGHGGQELYPPQDFHRSMGGDPSQFRPSSRASRTQEPAYHNPPRPASVRSSASKNPARESSTQFLGEGQTLHRIPSRSSMHSRYDPNTYVDPAFFGADGTAYPAALRIQRAASPNMRPASRASSGLEYVE